MDTLFRLNSDLPSFSAGTKVVKAADVEKLYAAKDIIEAAKQHAADLEAQAQSAYQQRYDQGYQDGLEAGKLENSEKMMETALASLEFIENIEKTVVDVVNQAIHKIIGDLDDKECVNRIVSVALNHVRGQQKVVVRVSPVDEPAVQERLAAMTSGAYLSVVADPRLEPKSCVLESELGVIDASLGTQLKAIENALAARIKA